MRHRPGVFLPVSLALVIAFLLVSTMGFAADDGTWQEFGLLQAASQISIYDAARDELLSVGGSRSSNWKLPLGSPATWQGLSESDITTLLPLYATVDPGTNLVYSSIETGEGLLEIQVLDPRTGVATLLTAGGTPPDVIEPALAFDPASHRVIVYGGYEDALGYDYILSTRVWALELLPAPTWSELLPSGTPPPAMADPRTVLDPVRRYLLIPDERGINEISALTLDGAPQWLHFPTNGLPAGPATSPFVFDSASDRVLTVDGNGAVQVLTPATWQWTQLPTIGVGPSSRFGVGLAVDGSRHRLLVSGGSVPSTHYINADTWALSLDGPATWTQLTPDPVRPSVRGEAGDALDPSRNRLLLFGGNELGFLGNDTWALALGPIPTWSQVATQGDPPSPRSESASAWDPVRDQLVVYGGWNGTTTPLGDLWTLSFQVDPPRWTQLSSSGPRPLSGWPLIYDPVRDRFLLVFGTDGVSATSDVWELRLGTTPTWRLLAPSGTAPSPRGGSMAAYDPTQDRLIVFGGIGNSGALDDLWSLDFAGGGDGTWVPIATPTHPSLRDNGLMRFDSVRNRMVLFGGYGGTELSDAWALALGGTPTWAELAPAGFTPIAREGANGAFDALQDRLILTCGFSYGNGSNDTWALAFPDLPTPTALALALRNVTADRVQLEWSGAEPGARVTAYRRARLGDWASLGELFADGRGFVTLEDRDITPGAKLDYRLGVDGPSGENFFGTTSVDVPLRALSVAARADGERFRLTVDLPTGEPASLAVYDLAGRRVWSRSVGPLGAGIHELSTDGTALPSALYFVRLTQGHAASGARVTMMK